MPSRAGSGSLCASRDCEVQDRRLVAARSGSGLRASGRRPAMALRMSMSTNSASSRSHRHLLPQRGRAVEVTSMTVEATPDEIRNWQAAKA
jgi:hypothetical protein